MTRQRVSSTNIRSIGYDPGNRILEVEFRDGGIYQYFEVPPEEYDSLTKAGSLGSSFAKAIKPKYRFRRVK